MTIGFDAKRAFMNASGLGQYSRNLILGLMKYYPNEYYTLFTPKQEISFIQDNNHCTIVIPQTWIDKTMPSWWRYRGIIKEPGFQKLQVYHGLSAEMPQGIEKMPIKKVVTIHDLIYEHYPQYYPAIDRFFYRKKTKHACEVADVIICASEQTKSDLCDMYDVTENKIRVVYQALSEENEIGITTALDVEKPYFVYVSSFNKRKNHKRLLKAFAASGLQSDFRLVLIGRENEEAKQLQQEVMALNLSGKVEFKHHCSDDEVKCYVKQSSGMLYPSEYEGFGLPILEGYRAGVPVLTSNCSSMVEVAQDACILVDPFQVEDIIKGLKVLASDNSGHEVRVHIGKKLLQEKFSIQQFVETTYQSYL